MLVIIRLWFHPVSQELWSIQRPRSFQKENLVFQKTYCIFWCFEFFFRKWVDFLHCPLETSRKSLLVLLFSRQPGFCILQAVYPLQSLRGGVDLHSPGTAWSVHSSASKEKILTWENFCGQESSTASSVACVPCWRGLAHHTASPGPGPSSCTTPQVSSHPTYLL